MNKKKHSQEFLRKRKMLLILPVIVIPLLSMVFYGMGGGKGVKADAASTAGANGYNMNLPGAKFNKQDGKMDKLSAYKKSDLDSARFKDQLRQDPYHAGSMPLSASLPSITSIKGINPVKGDANSKVQPLEPQDTAANAILKRLEHLNQALHQPDMNNGAPLRDGHEPVQVLPPAAPGNERLQELLFHIKSTSATSEPDPQLDRLNGMLDKILQIQHPENAPAKDTAVPQSKLPVFDLRKDSGGAPVADLVASSSGVREQAFFTLEETMQTDSMEGNVIRAIVEGNQTLVSGGTIALRLSEDAAINGVPIPRNNLLYGLVSLSGERMHVIINSIRYNNSIYPVTLQVFDLDGLVGIRIPGAISREVAKESADQAVSGIGMTTLDPSIGAQAASAGIQAAKTLFSRNVKLIRVAVPAGYQVFLRNIKK